MLFEELFRFVGAHYILIIVLLYAATLFRNKYLTGINKYPGPVAAGLSNWWRFFDVLGRRAEHTHTELHKKYGDIVRLGPRMLSFANPQAIKDIYGLNKGFTKTEFYPVQQNVTQGERIPSLFSTTDESYHAQLRRCVNSAFAMSTLVSYEPLVDSTTKTFLEHTEKRFSETGTPCDFARWLQFFAFDVIGQVTFSKSLGFLEKNEDIDGIVDAISRTLSYAGPIGQQPWLDRYILDKNPAKLLLMKCGLLSSSNPIAAFASSRSDERCKDLEALQEKDSGNLDDGAGIENKIQGVDFLTRFLLAQKAHPEFMTDRRVLTATVSLINAGSDTTAISLSSIFYFLLKHPRTYQKLMQELDDAAENCTFLPREAGTVSWADAQKLPYLDAVIQESFRLFPAVGLLLERHVPPGGATICGQRIPAGTIVGCNAWVLHRRQAVFGDHVDDFWPERWLEADAVRLKEMKATMFQFGAGARTCIGRNISTLEIYKLVPSFLRKFEIELVHPEKEWKTENCWFVRQLEFDVCFKLRGS